MAVLVLSDPIFTTLCRAAPSRVASREVGPGVPIWTRGIFNENGHKLQAEGNFSLTRAARGILHDLLGSKWQLTAANGKAYVPQAKKVP